MIIHSITIRAMVAPIDPPLRNSLNVIRRAPLAIADIQTDPGPLAALACIIGQGLIGRRGLRVAHGAAAGP